MFQFRKMIIASVIALILLTGVLGAAPAFAGERIITINSGNGNTMWFISGEPTLVMNGFDMASLNVALPATLDAVTISVAQAVPATPVELVIYQDANGGSPSDATLLYRRQFTINQTGSVRLVLPDIVTITQQAVWIGFYLPVDFQFFADRSGSSVLTYWGWTPDGTFDLNNLGSAAVLGPSDGSAPVNLNLNGKARITAEVNPSNSGGFVTQTAGDGAVDLAVLQGYAGCDNLLWDTADETISLRDTINLHCRLLDALTAPASPLGYQRRGSVYDVIIFKEHGVVASDRLEVAVTHCIRPAAEDLPNAVIGNAYGVPRTWRLLPTQRFGDLVCAELHYGSLMSYFVRN